MTPLSQKYYDAGQWFIRTFLPAFITLYLAVDAFFDLPKETEVTGTLAAVGVFVGALLASSSRAFKKENEPDGGYFQLKGTDEYGRPEIGLDVRTDPAALAGKKTVTLKIDTPPVRNPSAPELEQPVADNRPPWDQGTPV